MDEVIYTGEKTPEKVKKELSKLLNEFIRERYEEHGNYDFLKKYSKTT